MVTLTRGCAPPVKTHPSGRKSYRQHNERCKRARTVDHGSNARRPPAAMTATRDPTVTRLIVLRAIYKSLSAVLFNVSGVAHLSQASRERGSVISINFIFQLRDLLRGCVTDMDALVRIMLMLRTNSPFTFRWC